MPHYASALPVDMYVDMLLMELGLGYLLCVSGGVLRYAMPYPGGSSPDSQPSSFDGEARVVRDRRRTGIDSCKCQILYFSAYAVAEAQGTAAAV